MAVNACNPPPRIGLITGNFHPVVGGGERHARILARACARLGSRVTVITRRRTRDLARIECMDGFLVVRVPPSGFVRLGKYMMIPPVIFQIWKRRQDIDVIYVCGLRVLGLAGIVAAWLTGKPCVLRSEARGELSGDFIWKTMNGIRVRWREYVFRPLIRMRNRLLLRADLFVSISSPIHEEFVAAGVPPQKIVDIANGLDPELFLPGQPGDRDALRCKLGIASSACLFVYSGKLNRGKGLEMLLRAWKTVAARRPDALLLLVGSGRGQYLSCEDFLREYVEKNGLGESVKFTGYVERVQDYLRAADGFVFPSESEALPLAPLEAMACRVPVIASRIPGIMDYIEDGVQGRLIDPNDEEAWASALVDFKPDAPEIRRMVERAALDVREKFDIQNIARRHLDLFARLRDGSRVE